MCFWPSIKKRRHFRGAIIIRSPVACRLSFAKPRTQVWNVFDVLSHLLWLIFDSSLMQSMSGSWLEVMKHEDLEKSKLIFELQVFKRQVEHYSPCTLSNLKGWKTKFDANLSKIFFVIPSRFFFVKQLSFQFHSTIYLCIYKTRWQPKSFPFQSTDIPQKRLLRINLE